MNFIVGKFGKSVLFNSHTWGAIGGDMDAPTLFKMLFKNNPNDKFYIIGKSDYSRLSKHERKEINIHNNVIDVWEGFNKKIHNQIDWPLEKLIDIQIDAGVFY